jgi:hypothetical protein
VAIRTPILDWIEAARRIDRGRPALRFPARAQVHRIRLLPSRSRSERRSAMSKHGQIETITIFALVPFR